MVRKGDKHDASGAQQVHCTVRSTLHLFQNVEELTECNLVDITSSKVGWQLLVLSSLH